MRVKLFFTAMPTYAADFTFLHGQWCRGSNIRRFNKRSRDECESHCRKADCVCFQYKDTPTQEEGNCRFTRADEYTDTRPSKMGFNAWGCVPIVISDHIRPHLPFASRVAYDDFAAFVSESDFHEAPVEKLRRTMEALRPRLPQMQAALTAAAPDVTFSAPQSRVADNVLSEWPRRCRYD